MPHGGPFTVHFPAGGRLGSARIVEYLLAVRGGWQSLAWRAPHWWGARHLSVFVCSSRGKRTVRGSRCRGGQVLLFPLHYVRGWG